MKKEISDHIAQAFIEKKIAKKKDSNFVFFVAVSFVAVVGFILSASLLSKPRARGLVETNQNIVLEGHGGPYILFFDFTGSTARIASLAIDLPDIDLSSYKKIKFSARLKDADVRQLGAVKVTLENRRKETSSRYITDTDLTWKQNSLLLSDFAKIYDWSRLAKLTFSLEEWNLTSKKGELLIDDVQFSKN